MSFVYLYKNWSVKTAICHLWSLHWLTGKCFPLWQKVALEQGIKPPAEFIGVKVSNSVNMKQASLYCLKLKVQLLQLLSGGRYETNKWMLYKLTYEDKRKTQKCLRMTFVHVPLSCSPQKHVSAFKQGIKLSFGNIFLWRLQRKKYSITLLGN